MLNFHFNLLNFGIKDLALMNGPHFSGSMIDKTRQANINIICFCTLIFLIYLTLSFYLAYDMTSKLA
jgi:hypothetical protein